MRSLFKIKIPFVWNTTLPLCITGSRRFGTTQCSHLHGPIAQASQNSDLITHWRNVTVTPSLHRCNNLKIREIQSQFLPFPPSPRPPTTATRVLTPQRQTHLFQWQLRTICLNDSVQRYEEHAYVYLFINSYCLSLSHGKFYPPPPSNPCSRRAARWSPGG